MTKSLPPAIEFSTAAVAAEPRSRLPPASPISDSGPPERVAEVLQRDAGAVEVAELLGELVGGEAARGSRGSGW